jgi:hypothetical protein
MEKKHVGATTFSMTTHSIMPLRIVILIIMTLSITILDYRI